MTSSSLPLARRRVLIVDDHPVVRQGLATAIGREPDLQVCGDAKCIEEALRLVEGGHPDAVIIDLCLDGEDGIELIDFIKSRWPAVKILVYTAHDEETYAGRVLRAGATGFVSKREAMPKLIAAIRQVLCGQVSLSPLMTARLLQRAAVGQSLDYDPVESLSNRELQVFEMIGQGMSTAEIAEKLQVSPKTVESHRKVIKTKLHLETGAQLSRRAFQWVQEHS
jgi:DNA-binding NarL/FixJ family response regulator